ncbi:type II toxin-antitoxin system VapB family antitoxin [Nocardia lasii]|uniref:Type II toxin-antitoxin system VapB family antitoxin n=1 Tax=Nocardia lasii TaxID=1616107 RepID=A0ABW1JJE9_9NOCA
MTRTMIDLDDDLLDRVAKELGTSTKKETVHAALRAALRANAARRLMDRMSDDSDARTAEALTNEMWAGGDRASRG